MLPKLRPHVRGACIILKTTQEDILGPVEVEVTSVSPSDSDSSSLSNVNGSSIYGAPASWTAKGIAKMYLPKLERVRGALLVFLTRTTIAGLVDTAPSAGWQLHALLKPIGSGALGREVRQAFLDTLATGDAEVRSDNQRAENASMNPHVGTKIGPAMSYLPDQAPQLLRAVVEEHDTIMGELSTLRQEFELTLQQQQEDWQRVSADRLSAEAAVQSERIALNSVLTLLRTAVDHAQSTRIANGLHPGSYMVGAADVGATPSVQPLLDHPPAHQHDQTGHMDGTGLSGVTQAAVTRAESTSDPTRCRRSSSRRRSSAGNRTMLGPAHSRQKGASSRGRRRSSSGGREGFSRGDKEQEGSPGALACRK
eukprot:gnl/MRDRNA2_/MRDRNA2_66535_c0_seq1.p1 gnl/MRDRNA2_/MRDRNA2_66535_c0~~gnl/MRDRNA2_/MRDRNA2_66535_c0_seq1.p1  ORF type:complete len:379 (+),score=46.12 gnl/MRDRNA2_/MRDRNA2_66535_c0_seq1:38-1138(+)